MLFQCFHGICRGRTCVATFDHSDIRGLVTARPVFIAELPLSRCGSSETLSHKKDEDSPHVVLTPHMPWILWLFHICPFASVLLKTCQTAIGVCFAMAHIKAASSLATAVTTVLRFLPVAIRRRNLVHKRV